MIRVIVAFLIACAALPSAVASPSSAKGKTTTAKSKADGKQDREFQSEFRENRSFRFGKILSMNVRAKFQGDFRSFSPALDTKDGTFNLHRLRIGIGGTFLRHFEYELEYELRDVLRNPEGAEEDSKPPEPWRDAYLNITYFKDFQIQAGKFKVPFGMDQLTSPSKLDFIYRSRIGDTLAPGRDIGLMVHGRFFKRGLNYEVGLFVRDGENARSRLNPGAERTFAGRVTGTPLRIKIFPAILQTAELGLAFTSSTVPEGAKGITGDTVSGLRFFPLQGDLMFVHGQRLRMGSELVWAPGPFSLKGEFIHFRDERLGQSLRLETLPDLIGRGWYLSGTWVLTGERKAPGVAPRKEFLRDGGFGAVELALRYEQLRFGSSEHPGAALRNQRAANIRAASDRAWTFGVNWYLCRWIKVQFNAVREEIEDTVRSPIPGVGLYWNRILRLQAVM